jgi:ankyrin repeat protein
MFRGDLEILQVLVSHGALLNIAATSDSKMLPIHWAASDGRISSLNYLIEMKQDINVPDANGCTPLIIATQHGHHDCVIFLIQNGSDLNLTDVNGDNALHWAAYKGLVEMTGLLVHFMPRDVDTPDVFGQVN